MAGSFSQQEFPEFLWDFANEAYEQFKPFVFYNRAGDCVEVFVSPNDYFACRIDNYLTLYLDEDTEQVVGFVIKNVRRLISQFSKRLVELVVLRVL